MTSFLVPLSLPHLDAALRDAEQGGPDARWVAAFALGSYTDSGDARILPALYRLFTDELEEVRAQALEGLHGHGLAGAQLDVASFAPALKDPSVRVRCAAVFVLALEAPEAVIAALEDEEEDVRACAAGALCGTSDPEAIEGLARCLSDRSPAVCFEAARALAVAGDGRGLGILVESVGRKDGFEELAIEALGLLGDHQARDCLGNKLQEWFASPRLKALASAALVRCRDDSGRAVLQSQLASRRKTVRMAALSALCTLPVPGVSRILGEILDRRDDEEASSAIVALMALAQDAGDLEARRELESRRGRVRLCLQEELAEAIARLEEA